jgi:hypothetical protein
MKKAYSWYVMAMLGMVLALGLVLTGCEVIPEEDLENSGNSEDGGNSEGGDDKKSGIPLTLDTWAAGTLAAGGEQWFQFTATAANQYIHIARGTLTGVNIQLYNSAGNEFGSSYTIYEYSSNQYINLSVTSGSVYYIAVWPYSSRSGEYKIGFNTDSTPPN